MASFVAAGPAPAADLDLRLRIAWGGGQRSTWSGSISIDAGELTDLTVLGIENDAAACVWLDRNVIRIREGTARDYGGFDVSVVAPEGTRLTIRLHSNGSENELITEAALDKLVREDHRTALDSVGNYLLVTRSPGDRLRVSVDRSHVLYSPGETISISARVSPELVDQPSFQLVAEVARARSGEALHTQTSLVTRNDLLQKPLTVLLPAPREEGVYEARLLLRRPPSFAQRVVGAATVAERRIQFVVFDRSASNAAPNIEWQETATIDLANPNWASRLPQWWYFEKLPGVPSRPLSNVAHSSQTILDQSVLVLPPPAAGGERSWHAVPLSVAEPGGPHLITIDLPTGHVHQVGVTILEPNAAGYVYPVSRDFGVFSRSVGGDDAGGWLTRKFLFWPKTTSPMLLLTNEHADQAVSIGPVRLFQGESGGSGFGELLPSEDRRIAAVFVDRPWIVESLGAREALDATNNQSVDDWQTFYDATRRLVDYVQLGGYNAAVLSVFADGSTIYPTELLQSTPRYDTGVLASTAPDPVRKDFVELLLSAFDRSGLFLYLGLEFSTPLPELEKLLRESDVRQSGVAWIGGKGQTRSEQRGTTGGAAPRYNLLNERVQEAILRVVREMVARYDAHPSLRGIAVQLAGNGYAQLLEPQWGLDDDTIARFTRDTKIAVPGAGPQRFEARERFLLDVKRKEWVAWRAQIVTRFYARLAAEAASTERPRELLLLPTRLFDRVELRARLRPSLVAPANVAQVLVEVGLDPQALAKQEGIVLLRPHFDVPLAPLGSFAAEHHVNAASELDAALGAGAAGGEVVSFPSLTRNRRLLSFDEQELFGENKSFTAPLTQMRPLGSERRRGLAQALAERDVAIYVEGGQSLVTELDDDLRRSLEIFRKLPTGDCERSEQRPQPVTVRTYRTESELFVCLVNESAWRHTAIVSIEAPPGTQILELGALRAPLTVADDPPRAVWSVELPGYGLCAARISAASARVVKTVVEPSRGMQAELARRIEDLNVLAEQMATDRPLPVLENPAFEAVGSGDAIAGWDVLHPHGGRVELSGEQPGEGKLSARLTSSGPAVSLASRPFALPATGRLALSAAIRRGSHSEGVMLRIFLEDTHGGLYYQRYGPLGGSGARIGTAWTEQGYRVLFDDLPVETPLPLRVRFEVTGEGTVWIDNVQLSDLSFRKDPGGGRGYPSEQLELNLIILEAQKALEDGAYSDCLESLEGYWPRFLTAHVKAPLETPRLAAASEKEADSGPVREAKTPGVADRIKQMVPGVFQ